MGGLLTVEVAYALPAEQVVLKLDVEPGTTVGQAIEQSGIRARFPEIDLERSRVGVFGRQCAPEEPVRDGDRVEIYRPLRADPKEIRRQRAQAARRR